MPFILLILFTLFSTDAMARPRPWKTPTPQPAFQNPPAQQPLDQNILLGRIDKIITQASQPRLVHNTSTPWEIIHGLMAVGKEFRVLTADQKSAFLALEWFGNGAHYRRIPVFHSTKFGGSGQAYRADLPGFEGHPTQFMGYLTELNLPLDHVLNRELKPITVRDLLEDAKKNTNINPVPNTTYEASWLLMFLNHYLEISDTWENTNGQLWDLERLVALETKAPILGATCGGIHRLQALSAAVRKWNDTVKTPLRGAYLEANERVKQYLVTARLLQNSDGSFPPSYLADKSWAAVGDNGRLAGSGHVFEWLAGTLPLNDLKSAWIQNAALAVTLDLEAAVKLSTTNSGPYYHALHGLILYRDRLRGTR